MTGSLDSWLRDAAAERERLGHARYADVRRNPQSTGGLLDLASNDYLGLAGDPRLVDAAVAAIERFGTSSRASRVVTGTTAAHEELEAELCNLTGQPSALVFSSGYTANLAVLTALGDPGTLLVCDRHMHASLIDGARLSRSPVQIAEHGDLDQVEAMLAATHAASRARGRRVDLFRARRRRGPETLARICARFDAHLVVDEAHGVGVVGNGRGAVWAAGLAGADNIIMTATLSKAVGSQGGAVLGPPRLRDHLINTARSFIFDTGLAPGAAAAAAEACRVIAASPSLLADLHNVAQHIASGAGIEQAAGPVQSIPIGAPAVAFEAAERLRGQGIVVGCFRPPSVPDGISRLRLTARASLDPAAARRAAGLAASLVVTG